MTFVSLFALRAFAETNVVFLFLRITVQRKFLCQKKTGWTAKKLRLYGNFSLHSSPYGQYYIV